VESADIDNTDAAASMSSGRVLASCLQRLAQDHGISVAPESLVYLTVKLLRLRLEVR
jgi:hypothetical protein